MKMKCPNCNRPVSTYTVSGKVHCALCNTYIVDDPSAAYTTEDHADHAEKDTSFEKNIEEMDQETESENIPTQEAPRKKNKKTMFSKKNSEKKDSSSNEVVQDSVATGLDLNEDGFYNDVLPEVLSEIEHLPKEVFLKIFASILALFGSIVFLIFYF